MRYAGTPMKAIPYERFYFHVVSNVYVNYVPAMILIAEGYPVEYISISIIREIIADKAS